MSPADSRRPSTPHARPLGGIGLGLALGVGLAAWALSPPADATSGGMRAAFSRAVDLIVDRHVDPVDSEAAYARGIAHIVAGLDPYSVYVSAEDRATLDDARRRGLTTGLSLERPDGARLRIAAVLDGSPAQRAGLRAGDELLAIDGVAAEAFIHPLLAELALVRGPDPATDAPTQLRWRRPGFAVGTSALPRVALGSLELVAYGSQRGEDGRRYGVIRIRAFARGVGAAVASALRELERPTPDPLAGVVLDLRGNPGGEVDEALVVADLFLAEGLITRTRGRGGRILREEFAHPKGTRSELPLALVQDRHSASAAELLAGALAAHGRATLVGERSYGKGTVQALHGLPDGAQLRLTVARYYDPLDRAIEGRGVEPTLRLDAEDLPGAVDRAIAAIGREG